MAESLNAQEGQQSQGHGFGTAPVFLASVSTILGALMFLRFGYAVGHTGLAGALLIVLLGHMVTVPTALAIAGVLALNYPLLQLFDRTALVLGIPTLYLYLFSAWAAFILLVAVALSRRDRSRGTDGER